MVAVIAFFSGNRRTRYSRVQGQCAGERGGTMVGQSRTMTAHPGIDAPAENLQASLSSIYLTRLSD